LKAKERNFVIQPIANNIWHVSKAQNDTSLFCNLVDLIIDILINKCSLRQLENPRMATHHTVGDELSIIDKAKRRWNPTIFAHKNQNAPCG
jgi:hypothetical protein